ncbi:hypothetical protein QA649_29980 [Bradyrhizobium sp. CB1717]|uniref:hypothetical protein n=1 Tax=Bradyrhizobium sp. CB1717 TaxID=3039154 RepID=UPI0024B1C17E|nr:hypothetical protein [Bradyrhizobium sp. CB1717]WFU22293.1 hypothetical protein QA649_29980 [Bradyrhizobium sp. CB1717]
MGPVERARAAGGRAAINARYRRVKAPFMMRHAVIVLLFSLLAGCGGTRLALQNEGEESSVNLAEALADCRNAFPDQIAQAVPRADCIVKATELSVRPSLQFPELLDRENALRKALAVQVSAGKVSLLERNDQIAKAHRAIVAEEAERLRGAPLEGQGRSPLAVIQWRASNSDACARLGGNSPNCY